MKLSDLIQEFIVAHFELDEAEKQETVARERYLDEGGMSWGYAGQGYHDDIHEARKKVEIIKEKIDKFNQL